MDFFSGDTGDQPLFVEMDPALRRKLAEHLGLRMLATEHNQMLTRMKIEQLNDPTTEREERITEYKEQKIEPLNEQLVEGFGELLTAAVNIDEIKSLLPMLVSSVMRSVNLPLLTSLINIEPERAKALMNTIREFCESNLG
jgi:hypothetical protein